MTGHQKAVTYCGYCHQAYPAGSSCSCPEQRRVHAARRREIEARLSAQRQGVASLDPSKRPPRS